MFQARAYKRAGDYVRAMTSMEIARKLDLQDRFLNTKSAKYMFRINLIEEANTLLGMFTRVRYLSFRLRLQKVSIFFCQTRRKIPVQPRIWKTCNAVHI